MQHRTIYTYTYHVYNYIHFSILIASDFLIFFKSALVENKVYTVASLFSTEICEITTIKSHGVSQVSCEAKTS